MLSYCRSSLQILKTSISLSSQRELNAFFLDGFVSKDGTPLPMILQKSDGGYNYATTDLAALYQRVTEEKADRIIYVVDAGQRLHFQMVFNAAAKANYYKPSKVDVEHVPFGVVLGADGKKFKDAFRKNRAFD